MKNQILHLQKVLIFSLFFLLGCASNSIGTKAEDDHTPADAATAAAGLNATYFANLPCQGCRGLRVNIAFSSDNSYEKVIERLGSNAEPIYESGTWAIAKDQVMLTTAKFAKTAIPIRQFLFAGDKLVLLDAQGNPYNGTDKKRFIFKKP